MAPRVAGTGKIGQQDDIFALFWDGKASRVRGRMGAN